MKLKMASKLDLFQKEISFLYAVKQTKKKSTKSNCAT